MKRALTFATWLLIIAGLLLCIFGPGPHEPWRPWIG